MAHRPRVGDPLRAERRIVLAPAETLAVFPSAAWSATARARNTPVVVLLPGVLGSSFSMRRVTASLDSAGIPSLVVDLLGMGESARPAAAAYALSAQASRVAAILDSMHVTRAVVVGHATTVTVALHLAAQQPARVTGVLSLAGGIVDAQGTTGLRLALAIAPLLDNRLGRAFGRNRFHAAMREQSADDAWCTKSVVAAYLAPLERSMGPFFRALRAMSEASEPVPIASELRRITVPVRVLVGSKPSKLAPSAAEFAVMASSLADFRVDTVANAGTMLQEERPEAVTRAIVSLLAGADGTPRHVPARGAQE